MTNNNNHHYNALAFSRQPDTTIEQLYPSSGLVQADQRTQSGGVARLTRSHPLDADQRGISRVQARQPARQTGEWLIDRPTHKEQSIPSQIQNGTKAGKRPDTATNLQTSGEPESRGVHHHPEMAPTSQEDLERPLGGVRQDKARLENARRASRQPALDTHVSRAKLTNNAVVRSQSVAGKQKLVQVTLWVDPSVKEHLARRAREEGLSLSTAGAAFLRKAVQQDTGLQYSALLRPIIEDTIARQMAGIATRLTWLLVRIAFDAGQTRSLVTNILGRQQGVTQPLLKTILEASGRSAKGNIMRRTPQISELISSVEQSMRDANRGEHNQKTNDQKYVNCQSYIIHTK